MSIYPVPLQKWFPNPKGNRRNYPEYFFQLSHYETCRMVIKMERCDNCGKSCKYNRAWGHHSIPWGYGEVWCSEKCLYSPKKRKKAKRVKKIRGKRKKQWKREFEQAFKDVGHTITEDTFNALKIKP